MKKQNDSANELYAWRMKCRARKGPAGFRSIIHTFIGKMSPQ